MKAFKQYESVKLANVDYFEFNKERKSLTIASEFFGGIFPQHINVHSNYSGKDVWFRPAKPGDKWFDEDQGDGEQMVYVPETFVKNVEKLVVYHAF